ncbi:MAG: hypothetical protein AAB608_02670 [Patescibacteria group bacterium]
MNTYSLAISRTWLTAIASMFVLAIGTLSLFQYTLSPNISSSQADTQSLTCAPNSPRVSAGQDLVILAQGGTPPYQWHMGDADIAYITTIDSVAIVAFSPSTVGKQEITVTSAEQTARCFVIVQ